MTATVRMRVAPSQEQVMLDSLAWIDQVRVVAKSCTQPVHVLTQQIMHMESVDLSNSKAKVEC